MSATKQITTKSFPIQYLPKPIKAQELISKIENIEIARISNDYPLKLIERDKANELRSYIKVVAVPGWPEFMEEWM